MTKDDSTLARFGSWDLAAPPLLPRTRLYGIEPIGIGTPYVEAVTSYVQRLARAHCVDTGPLVAHEILPLLSRPSLTKAANASRSAFWAKDAPALNGLNDLARAGVRALETQTGRCNLRSLSLSTWGHVLPARGLLRRTRAWCPACYAEWQRNGNAVYEPLLWSVAVVEVCPYHVHPLHDRCPRCRSGPGLPVLSPRSRPGHCSACGHWLGEEGLIPSPEGEANPDRLNRQVWMAESVGELLAVAPTIMVPPARHRVAHVLRACVNRHGQGNIAAFAAALGLAKTTVWLWHAAKVLPQLDALLYLCRVLEIPLVRFLAGDDAVGEAALGPSPPQPSEPVRKTRARPMTIDNEGLRRALEAVLAEDVVTPPSMQDVARRLGRDDRLLYRHFPTLCQTIAARHRESQRVRGIERIDRLRREVKECVLQIQDENLPPTSARVAARLDKPGILRDATLRAARLDAIRELGLESG